MSGITITLWFDSEAEEAARFYAEVFKDSKMGDISRYPETGQEITGKPPGSVLTVEFEALGQRFIALNGGPAFTFNEAVSLVVDCKDQAEVDYYWDRLGEGGDPAAQQCGWLKDRFGVAWQVTPTVMNDMLKSEDRAKAERVFAAMLPMKKLDIAELQRAFEGSAAA